MPSKSRSEYNRRWRQANRDRYNEYARNYYARNIDRMREYVREYGRKWRAKKKLERQQADQKTYFCIWCQQHWNDSGPDQFTTFCLTCPSCKEKRGSLGAVSDA